MIINDWQTGSVKIVKKGPFYHGQLTISLLERDYRTMFMGRQRIVTAWGRSVDSCERRVRDKARKIAGWDQELHDKRRAKTVYR